ncbi:P-loop containing nucleoside triphosphate hydrolase protein [Colletotrichum godetiae]|uniref:P-loop containing nucleoside triphosphate hydrolase protein n=1 Tax=Colletotrichum godetiae TaxID=1209918 RepID=A0AAJ0AQH1_9PEZI|nr:P-loop containing nucleoside triphosphate hydrolase protein [Colletotrichum godetiae]KAK1688499.1 P-loop containing nucleoside triphosphate hydrolase protein [Colletotrichum godetiae]
MDDTDVSRQGVEEYVERLLAFTGGKKLPPKTLFILVMGMTGAGKSSFVKACTGKPVTVGHGLDSCTASIEIVDFELDGYHIYMIDTPGFNDPDLNRSDEVILSTIGTYLGCSYSRNVFIHGIVYLHRINDNRMTRSNTQNIEMFKALCGEEAYSNVALATTFWPPSPDPNDLKILLKREQDLTRKASYFGRVINGGARMFRHGEAGHTQKDSAHVVVRHLIRQSQLSPVVLLIQHELVDEEKKLGDTSAGAVMAGDLRKLAQKQEEDFAAYKRDLERDHQQQLQIRQSAHAAEMANLKMDLERRRHEDEREIQSRQHADQMAAIQKSMDIQLQQHKTQIAMLQGNMQQEAQLQQLKHQQQLQDNAQHLLLASLQTQSEQQQLRDNAYHATLAGLHQEYGRQQLAMQQREQYLACSLQGLHARERSRIINGLRAAEARYVADLRSTRSELKNLKNSIAAVREEAAALARQPASTARARQKAEQQIVQRQQEISQVQQVVERKEAAIEDFKSTRRQLTEKVAENATAGLVTGLAGGVATLAGGLVCVVQ